MQAQVIAIPEENSFFTHSWLNLLSVDNFSPYLFFYRFITGTSKERNSLVGFSPSHLGLSP